MIQTEMNRDGQDSAERMMPEGWTVNLVVPAIEEFFLTIRLTTAGVCSRAGMDIDGVEDMKTAVAEACYCFINQSSGCESLELNFDCNRERTLAVISAHGRACGGGYAPRAPYLPDMAIGILRSLVDGADVSGDDLGFKQIRLIMNHALPGKA